MSSTLQKAVTRVLSPLVRLLLRHGVSHGEFASWAKQAYVNEASAHFGIDGKPPTVSRMAIVTGINRKEVKRLLDLPAEIEPGIGKHNRALRVVTGWLQDAQFHDDKGNDATAAMFQRVRCWTNSHESARLPKKILKFHYSPTATSRTKAKMRCWICSPPAHRSSCRLWITT